MILLLSKAFGQKEKFGIAGFTAPKGWQRLDSNNIILFMDSKTANGQTTFCQIFVYPSKPTSGKASGDFESEWNYRVVGPTGTTEKPKTEVGTTEGWEITTGYANIHHGGILFTCMLVTATGYGREMSVLANVAGQDYMKKVQDFLNEFDLDSDLATALSKTPQKNISSSNASLNDYQFEPPARWYSQRNNNGILLSSSQGANYGCSLTIYPPQPSTGTLETDARNIYNQLYKGWQYRRTGEEKEDVSKGYTLQGLEYCMIEAPMQKPRPDGYYFDYENGQVLVISLGGQIAVIAGRHERGEMVCFCKYQYDYWNQFFNSFTARNIASQKSNAEDVKRFVGSWQSMGGNALTKYIFAANGRYQFIGAYTTTSRISRDMIEMRTSGFTGDGSYSVNGNKLTTTHDNDKNKRDVVQYRMEKVNHGGTGWKDRLYILDKSVVDGKLYEVCYEKELK